MSTGSTYVFLGEELQHERKHISLKLDNSPEDQDKANLVKQPIQKELLGFKIIITYDD